MIQLVDFTIGYGRNTLISHADAIVGDGRLTALVGRNGSGKSTLLRAIAGLGVPYSGRALVEGDDMRTIPASLRARRLAFVTTERVRISSMTCRAVVAMGRAPYTDWIGRLTPRDNEIVDRALSDIGMSDYADRTLDSMSDGECQRIMIARAMAQDTPVILLDEPTSFLDLPSRYTLVDLLHRLARDHGKCIFFSTHELDIALKMTDDIALLADNTLRVAPAREMRQSGIIFEKFGLDKDFC